MSAWTSTQTIVRHITEVLTSAGIPALVTLDPDETAGSLGSDLFIVLVNPPRTEWETHTTAVHTFDVHVLAPDRDPLTAWPLLDGLTETIAAPLEIDTSRLTMWQPATGDPWPCMHITLDTATI